MTKELEALIPSALKTDKTEEKKDESDSSRKSESPPDRKCRRGEDDNDCSDDGGFKKLKKKTSTAKFECETKDDSRVSEAFQKTFGKLKKSRTNNSSNKPGLS